MSGTYILTMDQFSIWAADDGISYLFNAQTACGGQPCEEVLITGYYGAASIDSSSEYCRAWLRNDSTLDYATIAECVGPSAACEFSASNTGPTSQSQFTYFSSYVRQDLGMNLTSQMRFYIGGNLPAANDDCYWDDLNISGYRFQNSNITETRSGTAQRWVSRNDGTTSTGGLWSYAVNVSALGIGNYSVAARASKLNYTTPTGFSFFEVRDDATPPVVALNSPANNTEANSSVTFTYVVSDMLSTVSNCSLYIDGVFQDIDTVIEEGPTQFFFPRIPLGGPHNWSVTCIDAYGNAGDSENRTIIIVPPELTSNSANISVSAGPYIEGTTVYVNATILNLGGSDTPVNFTVELWDGMIGNGSQVLPSYSINLTDISGSRPNETLSWSWIVARPGMSTLYLYIDTPTATNGSVQESAEGNNVIPISVNTSSYMEVFGNVTNAFALSLGSDENATFYNFTRVINTTGVIYLADSDSDILFGELQSLHLRSDNSTANVDFTEADELLNMTGLPDSINAVWASGADTPVMVQNLSIGSREIVNVPVINSTASGVFTTGILWDRSKDLGNAEYDATDKEPIVFVTAINKGQAGDYGISDFQSRVPAYLRNYAGSGGNEIVIYVELQ
jgi:hypothetical protein